jgi:hypothetical protein
MKIMTATKRRRIESRLARIAGRQFGLVASEQARGAGLSQSAVDRRVARGTWIHLHAGVYLVAGAPRSWKQSVMAACLAAGGDVAASHLTAGVLWGLIERRRPPVEVTVPYVRKPEADGFVVHRSRLGTEAVQRTDGIPVTSALRTLIDLAAILRAGELEEALDEALRREIVSVDDLAGRLEKLSGCGRRGLRLLGSLVRQRDPSAALPASVSERRVLQMFRRNGLPEPECQYEIRRGGRVIARVDLAYPDQRIAIEYDSHTFHGTRRAHESDRARSFELQRAGWVVPPLTKGDFAREKYVCRVIRHMLWERGHPDVTSPDGP